jgi:hypothetical protein
VKSENRKNRRRVIYARNVIYASDAIYARPRALRTPDRVAHIAIAIGCQHENKPRSGSISLLKNWIPDYRASSRGSPAMRNG